MTGNDSPQVALEKFVLGMIIYGPHPEYIDRLIEDDFTDKSARATWRELSARLADGRPTDGNILLSDEMKEHLGFIVACEVAADQHMNLTDVVNAEVEKLIRHSDLRHVFNSCKALMSNIHSGEVDTVETAADKLQLLMDTSLSRHRAVKDRLVGMSMMDGFRQIEKNLSSGRIHLGFPTVDACMGGGINLGEFAVIAARTNVGKSIMSIMPTLDTARRGKWVLLCSNEMTDAQMSIRMLANISQTTMGVIEKVYPGAPIQYQMIASASAELIKLPIVMLPNCYLVSQITEVLERRRRAGIPISLVVLDLIQRMKSDNPKVVKGYDSLTEVSRALQALAKRYNCVILSMAQVNRAGSTADRILVSHIEGSGAIEQDADKIFLVYGDKTDKDMRILELAKNRTGRVGDAPFRLRLDGAKMTFAEDNT